MYSTSYKNGMYLELGYSFPLFILIVKRGLRLYLLMYLRHFFVESVTNFRKVVTNGAKLKYFKNKCIILFKNSKDFWSSRHGSAVPTPTRIHEEDVVCFLASLSGLRIGSGFVMSLWCRSQMQLESCLPEAVV